MGEGLIFSGCACRALSTSLKNVCPGRTRQDMLAQLLPKTAISQGHIRLVIRSLLRECAVGLEGDTPAQKAKKYSRRLVRNLSTLRNLSQTSRRPLTNLSQTSRNLSETSHKPLTNLSEPLGDLSHNPRETSHKPLTNLSEPLGDLSQTSQTSQNLSETSHKPLTNLSEPRAS